VFDFFKIEKLRRYEKFFSFIVLEMCSKSDIECDKFIFTLSICVSIPNELKLKIFLIDYIIPFYNDYFRIRNLQKLKLPYKP